MSATEELTRLCAELPADKLSALLDFARSLHTPSGKSLIEEFDPKNEDDAAWERMIADQRPRPKLEALADAALAEGPGVPLEGNL